MAKLFRKIMLAAALLVPWANQTTQAQCALEFSMYNMYDFMLEGWEDYFSGGYIYVYVYQNDVQVGAVTLQSGGSGTMSVNVAGDSPVILTLGGADLFDAYSFTLDTTGGILSASLGDYNVGDTIAVINNPCPSCPAPINVVVSYPNPTGFTLSWSPSSAGNTYHVYLNGNYVDETFDTSYVYTGLNPSTTYTAGVRVVCSTEDSSAMTTATGLTTCAGMVELPYVMDFENEPNGSWSSMYFNVTCWSRLTNATQSPYVYVSNSNSGINHTDGGAKGIWWYRHPSTSGYGSYHCLVLPPVDTSVFDIHDLSLHFWSKTHNPNSGTGAPVFYVGILDDPTNINTFTYIDTIQVNGYDDLWRLYGTTPDKFAAYTGTGSYIGIRENYTGTSWYAFIDDVTLTAGWCDLTGPLTCWPENDQITMSWEANGASSFTVYCGNDTVENLTDTFYTFTGLVADSLYACGVAAECATTKSLFTTRQCRTSCDDITVLPYTQDFEAVTESNSYTNSQSNLGVDCWRRITNANGMYNAYPYVVFNASANTTTGGGKGLYWQYEFIQKSASYGTENALVLPPIDTSLYNMADLQVHFWAKPSQSYYVGAAGTYMLGVMTNPIDLSTFQPMDTIAVDGADWSYYGGSLAGYSGNGKYIALVPVDSTRSNGCYIDDISVTEGWCPMVENVSVEVDTNKVTLTWEPNGATLFTVQLGNTTVSETMDTVCTFIGLTPNTPYTYSITSICNGNAGVPVQGAVRTACLPINEFPWTENFETSPNGTYQDFEFIPCWNVIHYLASGYGPKPYLYVSFNQYNTGLYNHTPGGAKGIYWSHNYYENYGDYQSGSHYLVLPSFDVVNYPVNTLQLKFWIKASNSGYGSSATPNFVVGAMSDPNDDATFDSITTVYMTGDNLSTWQEIVVLLNDYEGQGEYIALYDGDASTAGWAAYIDDITLDLIPPCPPIKGLKTDLVTAGSAYVSWSYQPNIADPYEYVVEYAPVDTPQSAMTTTVVDQHASLLSLWPNTQYYVKVFGDCDDGNGASDSIVFKTKDYLCLVVDTADPFTVTIGQGMDYTSELPAPNSGPYSISQQIYKASEIGEATTLNSLAFHVYDTYAPQTEVQIYLGHTTATGIQNYFIQPDDQLLVYEGTTNFVPQEWYTYYFNTPFSYDPSKGNLLVTYVCHNTQGSYNYFYGYLYDINWNEYLAYKQSNGSFDLSDLSTISIGNTAYYRNDIILNGGDCAQMATCAAPALTTEYISADTVVVGWIPGADESTWDVSYRMKGDTVWTKVDSFTTAMQYAFSGLNPNTEYEFRVSFLCDSREYEGIVSARTGCGLLTQLPMVETFENVPLVGNLSLNNFIPCWYAYTDGLNANIGLASNSYGTYNITPGGSTGFGLGGQASYGSYTTVVLPGVDTAAVPVNRLSLSFWTKWDSYGNEATLIVGAMSDPMNDSTFVPYDTLLINNANWEQHTFRFTDFTADTCNYVAIKGLHPLGSWMVYIDDIVLDEIPPCEPVENLTVTPGTTSAVVKWDAFGETYQGSLLEYKTQSADEWDTLFVTGQNELFLTGLTAETPYMLKVTSFCGEDTMLADPVETLFKTKAFGCAVFNESLSHLDTIGSVTSNYSTAMLTGGGSVYGYAQQLILLNEIDGSGYVYSITLKASTVNAPNRHWKIYMGHSISNNLTDFEHPVDLTLVYDGITNFAEDQWNTIMLDEPFYYDHDYNLLVSFLDVTGNSQSNYFYISSSPTVSIVASSYSMPIDPFTVSGGEEFDYYRPTMILDVRACSVASQCAAPTAYVAATAPTAVQVVWTPGNNETAWNTYYRKSSIDTWTLADTGVTDTFYTFTGLDLGTQYLFRIQSVCDQPFYTTLTASTDCGLITALPFAESFDDWGISTNNSAVIPNCWFKYGTSTSNIGISNTNYTVLPSGYNGTGGALSLYCTGSNYCEIMMPALDTSLFKANKLQLRFAGYRFTNNYAASGSPNYIVGVQSSKDDPTTFVPVDTLYHTGDYGTWQTFTADLTSYTGDGAYIALRTQDPNGYFNTYVDDFVLELASSCGVMDNLACTGSTASSATLAWDGNTAVSSWQIAYGPIGFLPDNGTLVTATSNPFTLTPSIPSGQFYVRPLCDSGDTGTWNITPGFFYLTQAPGTIPYDYDFESAAEWANWQGITNDPNRAWVRGNAISESGSYSMYVSGDNGAYYKPYYFNSLTNTAVFRDINFGNNDTSFTLTFSARAGGTYDNTYVYDGLKVYVVDPATTPAVANDAASTPWGLLADLTPVASIRLDTVWKDYQASIDDISGVHRVAFFWYNQNTLALSNLDEPAAIDNIHIDYSTCPRPLYIVNTGSEPHSASFTWQGPAENGYQVRYQKAKGGDYYYTTTDSNSVTLTGLDSITSYLMWVRKVCGPDDTSLYTDAFQFMTPFCHNGTTTYNYDVAQNATETYYAPIGDASNGNNYIQTIVDSAFMANLDDDVISAIAFNPINTQGGNYYTCIYMWMANVSESDLSGGWIYSDNTTHVFEQVLNNANFNFSSTGWQFHPLETPFAWDGHSNVLITILRNHNTSTNNHPTFAAHATTGVKTLVAGRNGTPYTLDQPSYATSYNLTGDLMLLGCNAPLVCNTPVDLYVDQQNYQGATLHWSGDATAYEVMVKKASVAGWNNAQSITVNDTFYVVNNLMDSTKYNFRVRALCTDDESGLTINTNWAQQTFYTLHKPCMTPSTLVQTAVTYTTVTLNWNENGNASKWHLHVWNDQYDQTFTATARPYTVSGLTEGTDYYVAVSAQCSDDEASEFGDTITITTTTCQPISGLTVTTVTATTASFKWSGSGSSFDLELGDMGFTSGVNTQVYHVAGKNYSVAGLEPGHAYSVSVRTVCEDNVYGPYSAQVDFTTLNAEGIEETSNTNVSIYPNPSTDATTIAISGVTGVVEITLVDISGRVVMTDSVGCDGECAKRIQLSGLAQGAYFVRLSGDNVNLVKKLIVK